MSEKQYKPSLTKTFIKYPGGKSRMVIPIISRLPEAESFTDAFCGGGSISIAYANKYKDAKIYMNDLDPYTYSMWKVVVNGSENDLVELKKLVSQQPTIELFNKNRTLLNSSEIITKAYLGIFFHKCTFSGIFNGYPIGGFEQKSQWTVGCHYNSNNIINKIMNIRELLSNRTLVTNKDFRNLNLGEVSYFDPPYISIGDKLYSTGFDSKDHIELQKYIKTSNSKWLLSYNDHPLVRELYSDCKIESLDHTMTMTSFCGEKKCRVKKELLISKI